MGNPTGVRGLKYMLSLLRKVLYNYLNLIGSRGGAVLRALASHQCGPGLIPGPGVICRFSLLMVLSLPQEVFLQVLWFSPLLKNQHCQISIRSGIHRHMLNKLLSSLKVFRW